MVDQPASIRALPLAVARDEGCAVAYLPGLTKRRIADLYPGEVKTDGGGALIIAEPPARCRTHKRIHGGCLTLQETRPCHRQGQAPAA